MLRTKNLFGYTLIELSIVIMLIGIIAGSALHIAAESLESDRQEESAHILDDIEFAMQVYFRQHGNLPCPADSTLPIDDVAFGIAQPTPCIAASPSLWNDAHANRGAVPVKSLGLPLDFAFDSWEQQILYVVQTDYTEGTPPEITNHITDPDDTALPFTTEHLSIIDNFDVTMESDEPDNGIAYILVSFGKDKRGSLSKNAALTLPCMAATTLDNENCNDDIVFRDAEIVDTENNATYFYDMVRWKSRYNFKG